MRESMMIILAEMFAKRHFYQESPNEDIFHQGEFLQELAEDLSIDNKQHSKTNILLSFANMYLKMIENGETPEIEVDGMMHSKFVDIDGFVKRWEEHFSQIIYLESDERDWRQIEETKKTLSIMARKRFYYLYFRKMEKLAEPIASGRESL